MVFPARLPFLLILGCLSGVAEARHCHWRLLLDKTPPLSHLWTPSNVVKYSDLEQGMGAVISRPHRVTRIFFTAGPPRADGEVPFVRKDAEAVVMFLHGAGSVKSGGRNFIPKMRSLNAKGIAAISFDLPLHGEGPSDGHYESMAYSLRWTNEIFWDVRRAASEAPVFLVAHSFGTLIAQEYLARYPGQVSAALLASPTGPYHPALVWTLENVTLPAMSWIRQEVHGADVNPRGMAWAVNLGKQITFHRAGSSQARVTFLWGEQDPWFPGKSVLARLLGRVNPYSNAELAAWLGKKYPRGKVILVPNAGHHLFEHLTPDGNDLILEKTMEMITEVSGAAPRPSTRTAKERLASIYHNNPLFRAWLRGGYRSAVASELKSERLLRQWSEKVLEAKERLEEGRWGR